MTLVSTVNAILHAGATPVLVDLERGTGLIDPSQIEGAITERTRAILRVHLHGRPCNLDRIRTVAAERELLLIEDAAHAVEARYRDRKIGSVGDLTCFSFYATKNLTTAEGGMITTDRDDFAAHLKTLALHGLSKDAWQRFSDTGYLPAFRDLPVTTPPDADPDTLHSRHLYALLIDKERCGVDRDTFMTHLHERGIGTGSGRGSVAIGQHGRAARRPARRP